MKTESLSIAIASVLAPGLKLAQPTGPTHRLSVLLFPFLLEDGKQNLALLFL